MIEARSTKDWLNLMIMSVVILVLGEVMQLLVLQNNTTFFMGSDFIDYAMQSDQILSGMTPNTILKPFGAGLWIAFYRGVFGDNMAGFALFSSMALGLLPLLAFWFGWGIHNYKTGIVCAIFAAISPASIFHSVLAETPAIVSLASALSLLACYQRRGHLRLVVLSSFLLFFAYLCRPDFILYLLACLVLAIRPRPGFAKLFPPALFAGIWLVLIVVLSAYNSNFYGRAVLVRYDSYFRYYSIFQANTTSYHLEESQPAIRDIKRSLLKTGVLDPADAGTLDYLSWPSAWFVVRTALEETKGSWYEADQIMDQASFAVIRANLPEYSLNCAKTFLKMALFQDIPDIPLQRFLARVLPGITSNVSLSQAQLDARAQSHWLPFKNGATVVYDTGSKAYKVAIDLYSELTQVKGTVIAIDRHQAYIPFLMDMPLCIYAGIGILFWKIGRKRLQVAGMLLSIFLVFAAYSTGGIYELRYLASHSYTLWILAGWGYALIASDMLIVARG